MVSVVNAFIRRNIVVVLAVPPVVAATFGIYAKLFRRRPESTTAATAERTLKTEFSEET